MIAFIKIYFSALIYSYAIHLRTGSYRSLPQSFATATSRTYGAYAGELGDDNDEEQQEAESFYRPSRPFHTPHSSIASWSDFVSAPGRKKRYFQRSGGAAGMYKTEEDDLVEETLFDEDELAGGIGSSSHSKMGTEDNTSASTHGDEEMGGGHQRDASTGYWNSRSRS